MTAAQTLPAAVPACWGVDPELFFGPGPNMAGSITYTGTAEDRPVVIWGVTNRDTWERDATQPPGGAL